MVSTTLAVALTGIEGHVVVVEADIGQSLPGFSIIGLPDTALADARERVRAAATNEGCPLPARKITVNLSPASLPKHGSGFDLAIAIAILADQGVVSGESVASTIHLGELSLDGRLRPMRGVLPAVLAGVEAGYRRFVLPAANAEEAALVREADIVPVSSLRHAAIIHGAHLEPDDRDAIPLPLASAGSEHGGKDLADVVGQAEATEALVIAAAGGHHVFLVGPPGAGKSMLAERLPGILPDLTPDAALRVTAVRSVSGDFTRHELARRPPFEAPHHSISLAGLVGGGSRDIRPGAIARASEGVLFLDEAPEFGVSTLDSLRQPLESGLITVHRAHATASFPARFQLVLAANPCPCGFAGTLTATCRCPPAAQNRYLSRISGPLLDRVDLRLRVEPISAGQLKYAAVAGSRISSAQARARVQAARARARERLIETPWQTNAEVRGSWLREGPGRLPSGATVSLDRALEHGQLSLRGYDRALRVAWTLSDLDEAPRPTAEHVSAALALRGSV